jgi:ribosomal protein S27AE
MSDFPLMECAKTASLLIDDGATVHQKYTCANCGSRQIMAEANKFFTEGQCEKCSHITNIQLSGCNYMVIWGELHLPRGDIQ